eukprot:3052943-Alexandrium_andersonii.AAC.1
MAVPELLLPVAPGSSNQATGGSLAPASSQAPAATMPGADADEEPCVLDPIPEPHHPIAETEAREVLAGALSVTGARVAGVCKERYVEVLAGSKTVAWIDKQ